jgi:hypothetical protein
MTRASILLAPAIPLAFILAAPYQAHASVKGAYHATCVPGASEKGVVSVHVKYDNGYWSVEHTLDNAQVVERARQYQLSDVSFNTADGNATLKWSGALIRNRAMTMQGSLGMEGEVPTYDEQLTKNGQVIMTSRAVCTFDAPEYAPGPAAPTTASSPSPTVPTNYVPAAPAYTSPAPSYQVSVALNSDSDDDAQAVNVTVGSIEVSMFIDSGCSSLAIAPALADTLIAQGEATVAGSMNLKLAGGQKVSARHLIIHKVTLGGRTFTDVDANDGASLDHPLLGQRVLGKFSVDRASKQLVLG